jgi:hypothetical protein
MNRSREFAPELSPSVRWFAGLGELSRGVGISPEKLIEMVLNLRSYGSYLPALQLLWESENRVSFKQVKLTLISRKEVKAQLVFHISYAPLEIICPAALPQEAE